MAPLVTTRIVGGVRRRPRDSVVSGPLPTSTERPTDLTEESAPGFSGWWKQQCVCVCW